MFRLFQTLILYLYSIHVSGLSQGQRLISLKTIGYMYEANVITTLLAKYTQQVVWRLTAILSMPSEFKQARPLNYLRDWFSVDAVNMMKTFRNSGSIMNQITRQSSNATTPMIELANLIYHLAGGHSLSIFKMSWKNLITHGHRICHTLH